MFRAFLGAMIIKARNFLKIDGTIFVVTNGSKNSTGETIAQGVYKTQSAAKKFAKLVGESAEIRVGHFVDANTIETI